MRRMIINADDLGITAQRSHGIFLCAEHGSVTSASLLTNFSESQPAARHARERGLPTGLHFNFTQGAPLSDVSSIASLVTTDGYFVDRKTMRRLLSDGEIDPKHIEREARAQIEWFLTEYGQPTHVDGHHHIHIHPTISVVLVELFDRYGISFVRIPSEPLPPFGFMIEDEQLKRAQEIAAQAEQARKVFTAHGLKFADHFRGLALAGNASQRNLRHILGRLPEGVTELMVHPGSANPLGDPFESDPQRITELNMVCNEELKAELIEREITLCSYGDLY